jgi:hypothetical protein
MAALASQLRLMGRIIQYCFLALVCGFILRADNEFTIPLDDGSEIPQGIVVAVKPTPKSTFAFWRVELRDSLVRRTMRSGGLGGSTSWSERFR